MVRNVLPLINNITLIYSNRGISISMYNGDNVFECLHPYLGDANTNIVARDEHVHGIKRSNRHVKERLQCTCADLLFNTFPKLMTVELVTKTVKDINILPTPNSPTPGLQIVSSKVILKLTTHTNTRCLAHIFKPMSRPKMTRPHVQLTQLHYVCHTTMAIMSCR
mmetsp:Transcript_11447/g.16192  ORF Transcript_11447/g.16192 Transcript_11447/m.16192 type:complete len:165 (+) Transcript_11447:548-1042(+)